MTQCQIIQRMCEYITFYKLNWNGNFLWKFLVKKKQDLFSYIITELSSIQSVEMSSLIIRLQIGVNKAIINTIIEINTSINTDTNTNTPWSTSSTGTLNGTEAGATNSNKQSSKMQLGNTAKSLIQCKGAIQNMNKKSKNSGLIENKFSWKFSRNKWKWLNCMKN